jgi:hypothetical protein
MAFHLRHGFTAITRRDAFALAFMREYTRWQRRHRNGTFAAFIRTLDRRVPRKGYVWHPVYQCADALRRRAKVLRRR